MTITTKATVKVAAVATGLAMATSMLVLAPIAHAQTPSVCSFTVDLTIGSTGATVSCLQMALIAAGYAIPAITSGAAQPGYYGEQTKAAVGAWQSAAGVSPAAGYFGPISRAAWNLGGGSSTGGTSMVPGCAAGDAFSRTTGQSCTSTSTVPGCAPGALFSSTTGQACGTTTTPPPTTPTGSLAGTDGAIADVDQIGSLTSEEVAEGNDDVKVLGVDIEASSDGDIALKSVKVSFDSTGNTGSDNLDDYIDSVSVMLGSTEIGSADVADFTESSGVFSKSITLSGDTTIEAEEVAKLYILVSAVGNIDSGDISGDSWTVDIDNIRFIDGGGVTTTDSSTGEINALNVPIAFVSFSTSADTELKITTASDSPDADIVVVSDSDVKEGVSLLKGKLELEGTSDAVLDEFPVTFTVSGTATGLASTTALVTLKIGAEEFTETVSSSSNTLVSTITFDNMDFAIDAGETLNFEVLADINEIDGTILAEGDTIKADVTASNRNMMDVENSEGDQLSDSTEKSGTATGEAQELRTNGVSLNLVSATAVEDNADAAADTGIFTIKFKVMSVGDTIYVSSVAADATNETVDVGGTTTTATSITRALTNNTDTDKTTVGNYQIDEGQSETFTLTIAVPNGASGTAGLYKAALAGFLWDTADDIAPANTYTSNLDSFVTEPLVFLDAA